jgi:outer membrane lipoprotein-sorting protein
MRLRIILFSIFISLSIALTAQSEQEATKLLDAFSAKAAGAPSVSMKFSLVTENQMENSKDTVQGYVILSKDKYRLELPDNIIFFNGQNSWSYLPAEKEVTITKIDKEDNTFMSRPSAIFTMYKSGYKCRLIEELPAVYVIDMYPEDLKNEVIRIRITIGKQLMDLKTLEYKRRDGITATLQVREYDIRKKPSQDDFVFNKDKYKGVEVVDMR